MKKSFLTLVALAAITTSFAEKTVTTTVTVPGTAKSVSTGPTSNGGTATVVSCDPLGPTCYTETHTTVENSSIRPGDKIELNGTSGDNVPFHVVGGYISYAKEADDDGTTAYRYELSPTWNQY